MSKYSSGLLLCMCVCVYMLAFEVCLGMLSRNVGHMKKQLLSLGFQFDWERVSLGFPSLSHPPSSLPPSLPLSLSRSLFVCLSLSAFPSSPSLSLPSSFTLTFRYFFPYMCRSYPHALPPITNGPSGYSCNCTNMVWHIERKQWSTGTLWTVQC